MGRLEQPGRALWKIESAPGWAVLPSEQARQLQLKKFKVRILPSIGPEPGGQQCGAALAGIAPHLSEIDARLEGVAVIKVGPQWPLLSGGTVAPTLITVDRVGEVAPGRA